MLRAQILRRQQVARNQNVVNRIHFQLNKSIWMSNVQHRQRETLYLTQNNSIIWTRQVCSNCLYKNIQTMMCKSSTLHKTSTFPTKNPSNVHCFHIERKQTKNKNLPSRLDKPCGYNVLLFLKKCMRYEKPHMFRTGEANLCIAEELVI